MSGDQRNVLGGPLLPCSFDPLTGFWRDGSCRWGHEDAGEHCVCIEATAEFLAFSRAVGNDLSTPFPDAGFRGLKPGDRWCLCLSRWKQAHAAGVPPRVVLESTHERALTLVPLETLRAFAVDPWPSSGPAEA